MLNKRNDSWREQKPDLYSDVFRSVTLTSHSLLSITCIRDTVGHCRVCVTKIVLMSYEIHCNYNCNCSCCSVCVCVFSVGSHTLCIVFFFRLCHIPRLYVGFFIYSLTVLLSPPVLLLLLAVCVCVCVRVLCLLWCDVAYCVFNVFPSHHRWPLTLAQGRMRTRVRHLKLHAHRKQTQRLFRCSLCRVESPQG